MHLRNKGIADSDFDMFSSLNLPADPSFASRIDFVQDSYFLTSGQLFGQSEFPGSPTRIFTLSSSSIVPMPEPATLWLLGLGLFF